MKTRFASFATLLCACTLARGAQFKGQTIDDRIQIGYGLSVADVNGDGKADVLLVDKHQVVWYENPGWEKHVITEQLTQLDHVCIAAQDIDGDGKAEIAVGAGWNPGDTVGSGAVFYLIPPADRTGQWKPVELPHEPTVHRMWWVRAESGKFKLVVAPLHGRGNKNGTGEGVHLLEYTPPNDPSQPWSTRMVDDSMHMTHNFDPVQWDGDLAQEILFCGKEGILLLDPKEGEWQKTKLIGSEAQPDFAGAGEVRLGKLREGRFISTVEPMHGTRLVIYRERQGWKRQVLDSALAEGHALANGDLLHQGFDQIVVGWRNKDATGKVGIKLFQAKESTGEEWSSSLIDDNTMACEDLKLADLNGDGWLDIVAAGRATKNVKIYWNQGR